ncbi:MAG: RNA polymerase sigma factor [Planctomycetaceae bacterium]|jgi:RNA polymerase sigma-70 factor (ECF subfamily)|nr:RNA polymerase sigma factor [Planctomycetaceae bacterium]
MSIEVLPYYQAIPSLTTVEDAVLVSMAQHGDFEAFDEIDRRYRSRLHHFLLRHTHCFHKAEDLTQQTLLRAFEMINQLRAGEKIAAWLLRIAFCIVVDEARKSKRKPTTPLAEDVPGADAAVGENLVKEEERTEIWTIVKHVLSEDEFWAVQLRYVENFNTDEIARVMSRSKISVRVLLFRARNRLLPYLSKIRELS